MLIVWKADRIGINQRLILLPSLTLVATPTVTVVSGVTFRMNESHNRGRALFTLECRKGEPIKLEPDLTCLVQPLVREDYCG